MELLKWTEGSAQTNISWQVTILPAPRCCVDKWTVQLPLSCPVLIHVHLLVPGPLELPERILIQASGRLGCPLRGGGAERQGGL